MSGLVLICFGRRLVATGITSLRRLKGRASDQLSRTRESFRQLCNWAAHYYCSAIEGTDRVASQVVSFVAIAAAVAGGIVQSTSALATALARGGLRLLLEATDRVHAAIEALFNQVKHTGLTNIFPCLFSMTRMPALIPVRWLLVPLTV